jgi:protein-tyrosine phosphatase
MHTYWVIPQRFLAGEYPTLSGNASLEQLLGSGVTDVVSLVEPSEVAALGDYRPEWEAQAAAIGRMMHFYSFPIRDMDVPSAAQLSATLDAIDAILAANRSVYLHCWGGFGRTGTIVGCYLVRHGASGNAALEQLHVLRRSSPYADHPSPEREAQCAMVRLWEG